MATVKGTWRFHDVLTMPSEDMEQSVTTRFEIIYVLGDGLPYTAVCNNFIVGTNMLRVDLAYTIPVNTGLASQRYFIYEHDGASGFGAGWMPFYGDKVQIVTFPTEQEVSDEFYAWFTANAVELVAYTVSGKWKFKDVLTPPEDAFAGAVSFLADGDSHFNTIYLRTFADKTGMGVEYANITTSGGHTSGEMIMVYADGEYGALMGVSGWEDDVYRTVDFGTEPQTVSAEFYHWLTGNAVQPGAVVLYKGETIAELLPGQTVTLKCKGMKMADDVVVRA